MARANAATSRAVAADSSKRTTPEPSAAVAARNRTSSVSTQTSRSAPSSLATASFAPLQPAM